MKKNRQLITKSLLVLVLALFTGGMLTAQEKKVEKKAIKVMVTEDDDGNIKIDTTILMGAEFDGKWESIIEDEELLEKLKDIKVDVSLDDDGRTIVVKSTGEGNISYNYSIDSLNDGTIFFSADAIMKDIHIDRVDGDSTITVIVKSDGDDKEDKIMIWHSDDQHKDIDHAAEYKVVVAKSADIDLDVEKGEKTITYRIKVDDDGEGEEKVVIWSSDEDLEKTHDVIIKSLGDDDDGKVIIIKDDGDEKGVKVIREKEYIIIKEEAEKTEKDKKKKKKKEK